MQPDICACAVGLSLCKLKETGSHCAALKMCVAQYCIVLNLNDFAKCLFLYIFLHFVILIECKVDRVRPDFKCILFIRELHVHRLFIEKGVWARRCVCVYVCVFSFCFTFNTSRLIEYGGNCSTDLLSIQPRENCKGGRGIYDPDS